MNPSGQQDIYSAGFTPTQTVELQSMFQKCGFQGAEWIDIPRWIFFTVQLAGGQFLAGQKQSVGSSDGADFFLRRIQLVNAQGANGPEFWSRILLPSGHYLQSGNFASGTFDGPGGNAVPMGGTLTPGPLGLVKPEVHCPAGSNFTIDLLNVTGNWQNPAVPVTAGIVFEGVYRFRLKVNCP